MRLYTIGHSTHDIDFFTDLLLSHGVNRLLDVRGVPYSRRVPAYNRDVISESLKNAGIGYIYMGGNFGATKADHSLYDKTGCMDFERMAQTEIFKKGMDYVIKELNKGWVIALMCAEKHPLNCHRAILVARAFSLIGIDATHIMPDGNNITQEKLDKILLDKYFQNRAQLTLFENRTNEEYIRQAYKMRNRDIGYYLPGAKK